MTPQLEVQIFELIVKCRRRIDTDDNFDKLRNIVIQRIGEVEKLSTRMLASICDTYADCSYDDRESRNALLISTLVKMEKIGQSYHMSNTGEKYLGECNMNPGGIKLWDGIKSLDYETADVTNLIFMRMDKLIGRGYMRIIYKTILKRMQEGDTMLGQLNKVHGHIFDHNTNHVQDFRRKNIFNDNSHLKRPTDG